MNSFKLIIRAYDGIIYDGQAVFCSVVTPAGGIGLEARHEPFLAVLKENSEIRYSVSPGTEASAEVRSGLLSFKANTCTITVEAAETLVRQGSQPPS